MISSFRLNWIRSNVLVIFSFSELLSMVSRLSFFSTFFVIYLVPSTNPAKSDLKELLVVFGLVINPGLFSYSNFTTSISNSGVVPFVPNRYSSYFSFTHRVTVR